MSVTARSPVESHAGPAPRPLSSTCHYPLRLSGFRGVEEGLKSFEEKQVGLERRLLGPHLPSCRAHLHFLDAQAPGNQRSSSLTSPWGKCLAEWGSVWLEGSNAAALLGCLLLIQPSSHSTRFTEHLLYYVHTIQRQAIGPCCWGARPAPQAAPSARPGWAKA